MSIDAKLKVTEIQRFCMHDGPGIRTTVFLKGCPLHCEWCHNPETQKYHDELLFYPNKCIGCQSCVLACKFSAHTVGNEHKINREACISCGSCATTCPTGALDICGKEMSVDEILSEVKKDAAFYGKTGGITISGGEPFAQKENTVALLRASKKSGLSTVVETCGYADFALLHMAVPFVDLFLWDIKDTDSHRHKRYTGVSNETIIQNLQAVDALGARIRLRCILINGINTDEAHYHKIAELALGIKHLDGVELIPYHAYGGTKAVLIGKQDNGNKQWIPEMRQIEDAKRILDSHGISVI